MKIYCVLASDETGTNVSRDFILENMITALELYECRKREYSSQCKQYKVALFITEAFSNGVLKQFPSKRKIIKETNTFKP